MSRTCTPARFGVLLALVNLGFLCGGVFGDVPDLAFVQRDIGSRPDATARVSAIELASFGSLVVRASDGTLTVLAGGGVDDGIGDTTDPDVSFDATRIVFSGFSEAENAWRIFEIGAAGEGLRQITHSDRDLDLSRYGAAAELFESYDDTDPCYMPDGRICLVSTRYPGVAPDGRLRATNLFVVNADGSDLHRITTERFGADTPTVEPSTGRLVYSRWWRSAQITADPTDPLPEPIPPGSPGYGGLEFDESDIVIRGLAEERFPGLNSWFLAGINPDGTDMSMYTGFRLDRELTQAHRPSFLASGDALALFIPQTPFLGAPGGNGLRVFHRGPGVPELLDGPQQFPGLGADDVAEGDVVDPQLDPFQIASAVELADGSILMTAKLDSDDHGIWMKSPPGSIPGKLYDNPGTQELDAVPLTPRETPPVIADRAHEPLPELAPRTVEEAIELGGSFVFTAENIFFNAPVDVPVANAPPVGQTLFMEFYMNPQRESISASDAPILIHRVPVPPSGRIEVELPGGVPLFELLRRADDSLAVGRDGQIFHVGGFNFGRANEDAKCVGCHSGHSQLAVPEDPSWTNIAPSAFLQARSRSDFPTINLVDRSTEGTSVWQGPVRVNEITMRWGALIQAREIVVRAPPSASSDQTIASVHVETRRDGQSIQMIEHHQAITPSGASSIPLASDVDINEIVLRIDDDDVTGTFANDRGLALAEIEVIGRATSEPRLVFVRGDTTCDGTINITDPIFELGVLFLGAGDFCCELAADVNADLTINISDPIFELSVLFLGARPIPAPFPACGPAPVANGTCDLSVCP